MIFSSVAIQTAEFDAAKKKTNDSQLFLQPSAFISFLPFGPSTNMFGTVDQGARIFRMFGVVLLEQPMRGE